MKQPVENDGDYSDGRKAWDWKSRYPIEARRQLNREAGILTLMLVIALLMLSVSLGLDGQSTSIEFLGLQLWVSFRLLIIFFAGFLGGITFSMKWLIHAVAKGKWHQDRLQWRILAPALGGVYACVVMALWSSGFLPNQSAQTTNTITTIAPLAFLVGYFSDGVSGLLSNVANAVFGTVQRK